MNKLKTCDKYSFLLSVPADYMINSKLWLKITYCVPSAEQLESAMKELTKGRNENAIIHLQ